MNIKLIVAALFSLSALMGQAQDDVRKTHNIGVGINRHGADSTLYSSGNLALFGDVDTLWESVPYSFCGSLMWETTCEIEPPAINDLMATTFGGVCIGEVTNRMTDCSSTSTITTPNP